MRDHRNGIWKAGEKFGGRSFLADDTVARRAISDRIVLQRTLKTPIHCNGVGLHSGAKVAMSLFPAPADHGIQFRRTDIGSDDAVIAARWDLVSETDYCTVLSNAAGNSVSTVEHLMAALAGAHVDNALIAIDGPEVPIMDGSAAPFVFLIECAGTVEQTEPRWAIKIERSVMVADQGRIAALSPSDSFSVSFEIDFPNEIVGRQECFFQMEDGTFKADISRARTFGFMEELAGLRAAGLARGGSLENAVMIEGDQVLNAGGLRFDNEFVRHKVLDCIGDLYLAGGPIRGHFRGVRTGHRFNNQLLRALFADPTNWRRVELYETEGDAELMAIPA